MSSSNHLTKKPLHMQKGMESLVYRPARDPFARPSYRDESTYPGPQYHRPARTNGACSARRYADGKLDVNHLAKEILGVIFRLQQAKGNPSVINEVDRAVLSLVMPGFQHLMDPAIARLRIQITNDEILQVRQVVQAKLQETANYNAGYGGGTTNTIPELV